MEERRRVLDLSRTGSIPGTHTPSSIWPDSFMRTQVSFRAEIPRNTMSGDSCKASCHFTPRFDYHNPPVGRRLP